MATATENMIPVKPSQLRGILVKCFKGREPVCIVGAPGIGKTDSVQQAFDIATNTFWNDTGADILVMHPVVTDPTDWRGLPVMTVNGAEFSAYGDLRLLQTATRPLVCFIDDLGQASNAVQAAVMQLVLARRINGVKISNFVIFIAATNDRTHRAGVTGLLEPLKKGRFTMLALEPDFQDWCVWAAEHGVSAKVIAYLALTYPKNPLCFSNPEPTPDMSVNPSPRGWEVVSRQYALEHSPDVLPAVFAGNVGKEHGAGFAAFLRVFDSMINPDVVLADPVNTSIPTEPSALWALCSALAYRVKPATVKALMTYLERMVDPSMKKKEFVSLTLKLMTSRDPALQTGADYISAMTGPLGKLMLGVK